PVRTHTRPCSRREQGLVCHGGAEGIRTLTPSMRTRCATGLRHSPEDIPRLAGFGECSEPTDPVGGCRPKAPRGSYGKKSWWALQSPAALRRASTYWS